MEPGLALVLLDELDQVQFTCDQLGPQSGSAHESIGFDPNHLGRQICTSLKPKLIWGDAIL